MNKVALVLVWWMAVALAVAVRVPDSAVMKKDEEVMLRYKSLVFIKFHKVGSSTSAVKLGAAAVLMGFKEDCENGGEGSFCVQHDAMHQMQDGSLGNDSLSRIMSRYPEPFLVTVMRDPIEKFTSFIYYRAWLDKVVPSEEYFFQNREEHWETTAEYTKALGSVGSKIDVVKAVQVLNKFHVVGITSDISGMLAQVAHHLHLTAKDMMYMSVTTMPGRPKMEDMSAEFQAEAYRILATEYPGEVVLYRRAEELHKSRMDQYKLHALRDEIDSMSKSPEDMDCNEKVHAGGVSAGGRTCIDPTIIRDSDADKEVKE